MEDVDFDPFDQELFLSLYNWYHINRDQTVLLPDHHFLPDNSKQLLILMILLMKEKGWLKDLIREVVQFVNPRDLEAGQTASCVYDMLMPYLREV